MCINVKDAHFMWPLLPQDQKVALGYRERKNPKQNLAYMAIVV